MIDCEQALLSPAAELVLLGRHPTLVAAQTKQPDRCIDSCEVLSVPSIWPEMAGT